MRHDSTRPRSSEAAHQNCTDAVELLAARFPRLDLSPRRRSVAITSNGTASENLLEAREAFARARAKLENIRRGRTGGLL